MPKFKVSYETSTRPTDLPKGAVVEQLPTIPLHIKGVGGGIGAVTREVDVQESVFDSKAAFVRIAKPDEGTTSVSAHLTADEAVEVADALYETAGRKPVVVRRDYKQGDRVRLTDTASSYVGVHQIGDVGTVTSEIDGDDELFVQFDGSTHYYVKFYELAAA